MLIHRRYLLAVDSSVVQATDKYIIATLVIFNFIILSDTKQTNRQILNKQNEQQAPSACNFSMDPQGNLLNIEMDGWVGG